jgi:hypothetical protein
MRRSQLESYALFVCVGMLIGSLVALYYLGLGVIACVKPEYTISRWTSGNHQTNERYWKHASFVDSRPRPSEEALTAERERSWQVELQLERREGARMAWMAGYGLVVTSVIFGLHWRVARRARREEKGTESETIRRPLVLAAVTVSGFFGCFCSGLGGGLLFNELSDYRSRFDEESRLLAPILGADPAFAEVEIRPLSSGGAHLIPSLGDS